MLRLFTLIILTVSSVAFSSGNSLNNRWPYKSIRSDIQSIKLNKPVKIAIIDTGVDFGNTYINKNLYNYNANTGSFIKANLTSFGVDTSSGRLSNKMPTDTHGHGTHIASIISSFSKQFKIIPIKYYSKDSTDEENLDSTVQAIYKAIEAKVDIINYSSGGEGYSEEEFKAIKLAEDRGILVVAAAGNYGSNIDRAGKMYFPASYKLNNIISVLNVRKNLTLHKTSNYGNLNGDIAYYGTDIPGYIPNSRVALLTGTSQSTAFVTVAAALIKSNKPNLNYLQIKNILIKSVRKSNTLIGKCKSKGILNFKKLKKLLKN